MKIYWRCWSDWGSSLSAIHMSLGRVSPHVRLGRLTSARKSFGVVGWREIQQNGELILLQEGK